MRPLAIICDIDETLCTEFDHPILAACRVIAAVNRAVQVHYVTARTDVGRKGTEEFLCEHRLPGWKNLHFCPQWQSSQAHKTAVMARLACDYQVIVSIGDADEDEAASLAAGVPFIRITDRNIESAWREIAAMVEKVTVGIDDPVTRVLGKESVSEEPVGGSYDSA